MTSLERFPTLGSSQNVPTAPGHIDLAIKRLERQIRRTSPVGSVRQEH